MNYVNPETNKHLYYFNGINDLADYIKENNTPARRQYWWSDDHTSDWNGNLTLNEAFKKLVYGDEELAEKIEDINLDTDVKSERLVNEYLIDIQGVIPHVPNAILGLPHSMINIQRNRVKTNNKILNIVYDASASGRVDADDYMRVNKIFLNIIDKLEKLGYRCNVYFIMGNHVKNIKDECRKCKNMWMLKLKDSSEPFNKYKCAFVIGHVAMFRKIGFKLIELEQHSDPYNDGYGIMLDDYDTNEMIKQTLQFNNVPLDNYKYFGIYEMLNRNEDSIIKEITNIKDNNQN